LITGLVPGTVRILASSGSISGSNLITVTPNPNQTGGSVSGIVINGSALQTIAGATITGGSGGTTNSDGVFTVGGLTNGATLTFSASGFVSTQYFGVVVGAPGTNNPIGAIPLAPSSASSGTVSGQIIDATTGYGIASASIDFRSGVNATTGSVVGTATAN